MSADRRFAAARLRRSTGAALALAALLALAGSARAQLPASDRGTFVITKQDQPLGTERFSLRSDAQGTQLTILLDYSLEGKTIHQEATLRLGTGGRLESYHWAEGDRAAITVRYADGHLGAHYQAGKAPGSDFQFYMPATTAILDENIYSLWEVLAGRYNRAEGGAQKFSVFVPHSGDPSQVTLSETPGAPAGTLRLHAQTDQADLDMDCQGGRLMRLTLPAAELEVTRQGAAAISTAKPK